jgi:hypothetical protein
MKKSYITYVGRVSPSEVVKGKEWKGKINLRTTAFPEMDFLIESRDLHSERNLNSSSIVI